MFLKKIGTGICYQLARQAFMYPMKFKKRFPFYIANREMMKLSRKGAAIFVSNHRNKNDQFIPMMAISRTIHTTPKKEYFTGEDVMFSKRFDKMLLTATGGIRIDRRETLELIAKKYQTTDDVLRELNNFDMQGEVVSGQELIIDPLGTIHIVSDSSPKKGIQTAIKYLNAGRSIILYPEGTRNTNQDPTELLPFQSGYANWARETGALIAPISQTGDFIKYNPNPNIIINFREPFRVTKEMTNDECHAILRERFISGIEENIQYSEQLAQGSIPSELQRFK
jgi:1-acyl-sn-glycerol-3-phosphate acyltransferase